MRSIQSENSQEDTPLQSPSKLGPSPSKFGLQPPIQTFKAQPDEPTLPKKRNILKATASDEDLSNDSGSSD